MIVLVTGFEPFQGATYNPSGETALALDRRHVTANRSTGPRRGRIVGVRLPVLWDDSAAQLEATMRSVRPHVVISLGEGDTLFHVEQLADDARIHGDDNRGAYSTHEGSRTATLPTRLPRARIEAAIGRTLVSPSTNAGGYICNEVFYRLMQLYATPSFRPRLMRAGFIHVPNHTVVPSSISQALVDRAILNAVRVTIRDPSQVEMQRAGL
jgi:pyroglutamyl-peptidase